MTYSTTPLKDKTVRDLDFLKGRWSGKAGDDFFEEYWLPEINSTMACVFRWIKKGEIYIYELVTLVERDGEIRMLLRHFDKELTAWEEKESPRDFVVTELSENEVVFIDTRNPEGGFLRYDTSKEDTLEFFDHEPDGTVNFSLSFKKVSE
jgi:hypothetical protein